MNPTLPVKNRNVEPSTRKIAHESRSNFRRSFFFLPKDERRGIEAVYAFCRLVDDAVDESASPAEAEQKLSLWREELDLAYVGDPDPAIMREIAWAARRFSIPKSLFEEILKGVEMDLHDNRFEDFQALCDYTYGVASVVGLVCMKIFGVDGEKAEEAAILLGRALQLTNILRDLKSDAVRGRIYLPLKDLRVFSVTEDELLKGKAGPHMDSLLYYEIGQVEAIYAQAFRLMKDLPRRPLLAAWIMGRVYYRILQAIKKNPRRVLREKIQLSKPSKLKIILKEWVKSRF